jgi:glycosyltransferase involved in cell wall biosynthesis
MIHGHEDGSRRLKVLASAYAFNPEGALHLHPGEDIVGWKLVEQLSRFYDVRVITHSYNRPSVESHRKKGALPGVEVEYVELPFDLRRVFYKFEIGQRIYYYLWQILALRRARQLHRRIRFDAAQHVTFNNDWIPSQIGARLPVPFIWGPVGGGQRTPKAFYEDYGKAGIAADKVRLFGQWIGRHLLMSRHRSVRRARAILVCNNETREKIPQRFRHKVHYFPVNGIAEEDVTGPVARDDGAFRVLSAGRMIHWKNFGAGLKAFGKLHARYPGCRLTMVGDGPNRRALESLASELGLEECIRFVDWMPRHRLFHEMRASDVFLHPALREGGGAVVVEAMACGLPVIGLDNAGPGMHIKKEWGIKIKPQSPRQIVDEMAEALKKLYENAPLRRAMGQAALKRAAGYYVWDRQGERLRDIYEGALSSEENPS